MCDTEEAQQLWWLGPEFAGVRAAYDGVYGGGAARAHATCDEADDAFEAEYIARQARIEAERSECSLSPPPPPTAPPPLYIYDTDPDDDGDTAGAAPSPHDNDDAVTGARHAANYEALRSGRARYDDEVCVLSARARALTIRTGSEAGGSVLADARDVLRARVVARLAVRGLFGGTAGCGEPRVRGPGAGDGARGREHAHARVRHGRAAAQLAVAAAERGARARWALRCAALRAARANPGRTQSMRQRTRQRGAARGRPPGTGGRCTRPQCRRRRAPAPRWCKVRVRARTLRGA